MPALFSWAGIYFVIISPWSNISPRRGADTDTKLLLFGWDNFLSVFGESLSLAMERLHSQSSCCLFPHSCWRHLYQAAHQHSPVDTIDRYYRYLHHCSVSRKHTSAHYTAWSCIVPIYRPVFVILILQWPGAPPTAICHRACNNLAGDICHRKAISSPASAACIQLPPAHRKLDLCTAPLHV